MESGSLQEAALPIWRQSVPDFVWDVSLTFGARLLGVAAGAFTLTVTARMLGPEGRGEFAVVMALLGFVLQFSNFGLHVSATYQLARHPERRKEIGDLLWWFSVLVVGFVATAALVLALEVPRLVGDVPPGTVALALATAPPAMFVLLASNALLGLRKVWSFNSLDLGTKVAGVIATASLFWGSLTALFVVYALLHSLLAVLAYRRLIGLKWPAIPARDIVSETLGYGLRAFLVALFMFVALRIDLLMVNWLLGTTEAGRYSVAVQFGEVLSLGAASTAAILFPRLAAQTPRDRRRSTRVVAVTTAVLLGVGGLMLGVGAKPVLQAWFGQAFTGCEVALRLLLPGLWCLGVNTIVYQHLAASGMPWFVVGATATAAIVNIAMNMAMIPAYGIAGAAITSSMTYASLLGSTLLYSRKTL